MNKIKNQPTNESVNKFHKRATRLVNRCATSPQYVNDVILSYMYQLQKATISAHNRKIQNTRDSNLIDIFRVTYPREFRIALIKNESQHGRS